MAPPRHNHHHSSHHHHTGPGGSPFPPLGVAAANAAISSSNLNSTSAFSSSNGSSNNEALLAADEASSGLPAAPNKVDASQAQACRLQDAYWSDEEEDMDCPLCLEEIDLSDANFKPCPCGYQICRFCWHHIKQNLNGRCPACRRKYTDNSVEFKAMSQDEIKRLSQAKKQKEREKRELEQMNRKHLANMRVVQKNLVYVVGLDPKMAKEEFIPTLRSNEFFGQYGRISKILISKRTTASKLVMGTQESAIGVYVTYVRKEDAARAIVAIDGSKGPDQKTIRASYGTTKYCTNYLRNLPCTNTICTYLHEPGEEADSFTKEDLSTLRHAAKDTENKSRPVPPPASFSTSAASKQDYSAASAESIEASALPKTASWASSRPGGATATVAGNGTAVAAGSALRDQDLPPLSALQQTTRKNSSRTASASATKTPAAAKSRVVSAVNGSGDLRRSESPSLLQNASPASTSSPLPSVPPGLARQPSKGSTTMQSAAQKSLSKDVEESETVEAKAIATNIPPSAPPGLPFKASAFVQTPPASRSATPSQASDAGATRKSTVDDSINSTYQPSSKAQALLDDMRSRREAEAYQPVKNPFPDFDATLSSFRDGDDFCFTFEESLVPTNVKNTSNGATSLTAYTPFAMGHSDGSYFNQANATAPPPPPGITAITSKAMGSPAVQPPGLFGHVNGTYTGRFDPFAPGAGETIPSEENKTESSSPYDAFNQTRRPQGDERSNQEREDEEGRLSRFGFSKRRESPFFKNHDDLLGFVKGGAARMTESEMPHARQEQQPLQSNNSASWLSDLQMRASAAQLQSNQGNYSMDRFNEYGAGNAEDPLLSRLNNYRSMEGMPFQDPAIASFGRQQQVHAHAQQHPQPQNQLHQHHHQQPQLHHQAQVSPQDSYGGIFNPFEGSQSNPSFRSANSFQQPYSSHRTFA